MATTTRREQPRTGTSVTAGNAPIDDAARAAIRHEERPIPARRCAMNAWGQWLRRTGLHGLDRRLKRALGVRKSVTVTTSQLAATIAAVVGEDFRSARATAAPPLPLR